MSHGAMVRSSTRGHRDETDSRKSSTVSESASGIVDDNSQCSVISICSDELEDFRKLKINNAIGSTSLSSKNNPITHRKTALAPLDRIDTLEDIEACVDSDLNQTNVLDTLELKWTAIIENFELVLCHLKECSNEITEASVNCLSSLTNSISLTCDKVDNETKALYHLMTKCDELTTKLSAASSFRDEVKTLRKSVETLENLYRSKTKMSQKKVSESH